MAINVFVDQGHNPSGINAGAEGFGYREQDITYMVGRYLGDILSNDSRFEVRLSRPTAETSLGTSNATSLMERVNLANEWPADFFISIHVNSNPNPDINGTEVYVYEYDDVASALAEQILLEIVRRTGMKNNSVRENPSLYVLRRTQMPAVLVELGYISNSEDVQKLVNDQYQFAYGIYAGLLNFLELPPIL